MLMADGSVVLADVAVFAALISALLSVVCFCLSALQRADDLLTDISTGLHRELARAISSSNLAGGEADAAAASSEKNALNPAQFRKFRLQQSTNVSHNTKLLRFEIPGGRTLGLAVGRHVSVRGDVRGTPVMRAYTPTSRPDTEGYFELLVKTYPTGKLSPYLHALKPGDMLEVRGPVGRFKYTKNAYKKMGFVAGGTGLTPCLQVIRCLLEGPEGVGDTTTFSLYFQNRSEEDILMRAELDALVAASNGRLQVTYFLSNPTTKGWGAKPNERKGYINKEAMALLRPEYAQFVGVCGPGGFCDAAKKLLTECGHTDESVHIW